MLLLRVLRVNHPMNDLKSYTVYISGIVQGVGMRPFIFKLAKLFNLGGWVSNHGSSVVMEITGSKKCIGQFLTSLLHHPPIGAKICSIRVEPKCYISYDHFSILQSSSSCSLQGFIPPDTAVCEECLKEIRDKKDRRYSYAFTNCTICGPRYSIIKALPYDRFNTAMSGFQMCPSCRSEYGSPDSRRFHSQTNCCPDCGPRLSLLDRKGTQVDNIHPIETTRELLHQGSLIAIKGIGGYHLACNACNEEAVNMLRQRKRRPDRPLAIMAACIDAAKLICKVSLKEEALLTGRQRPIVLLEKKEVGTLPLCIAPQLNRLGVILPYTPLHHLLFDEKLQYLVMTSGNISGMPICYKDEDALEKLKDIADFFLVHNREILTPIDDSVVRVIDEKEMVSRCARGYAPAVLLMETNTKIMAMGAEQKASICLLHKGYAHISQYLGSLGDNNACTEYIHVMNRMKAFLDAEPCFIVHDMHPGYFSTQYTSKLGGASIPIQHHHAHMAACMAEHGLKKNAIGVIYDGTGMGTDGAVWGGEFLVGSISRFIRSGHWKYVTLQGGESAITEPWKCAVSYLHTMDMDSEDFLHCVDAKSIKAVQNAIKHHVNCFKSSSMGRLFDCVSALVIKRTHITYDAQAAVELQSFLDPNVIEQYPYTIHENENKLEIDYEEIISGVLADLTDSKAASHISAKFHNTVCVATIDCVCRIRSIYGLNDVVLSGGVFENTYLLTSILEGLKSHSFNVYCSMRMPVNDGGISFGQAAAAAQIIKEENYVSCSSSNDCIHT